MQGGVATAAAAEEAAETVTAPACNGGPAPPQFLMKTYEMVNDPATDDVVSWGPEKKSLVVWNTAQFARDLLPKYFNHSNFSSFVRELNTYLENNHIHVDMGSPPKCKLHRTVFVGNLPVQTKRKELTEEFTAFGEIESSRIFGYQTLRSKRKMLNKEFPAFSEIKFVRIRSQLVDTTRTRNGAVLPGTVNELINNMHAYIVFKGEWSARAALSHNMALFKGNHICVDILRGGGPLYDNKRTVCVGNLPFDVKDEELYQLFGGSSGSEGGVVAIRVIRDSNSSLAKGTAYFLFKTREAANSVVRKHDMKIRDHPLRLTHAEPVDATLKVKVNQHPSNQGKQSETNETGASDLKGKRPAVAARKEEQLAKKLKLDV